MVPLVRPICICCVVLCVTYHKMSCGTPSEACLIMTCLFVFQAVNCKGQHSISYTLSRNQTVVVEYSHDNDTDMFQVKYPGNRLDYTTFVEGGNFFVPDHYNFRGPKGIYSNYFSLLFKIVSRIVDSYNTRVYIKK